MWPIATWRGDDGFRALWKEFGVHSETVYQIKRNTSSLNVLAVCQPRHFLGRPEHTCGPPSCPLYTVRNPQDDVEPAILFDECRESCFRFPMLAHHGLELTVAKSLTCKHFFRELGGQPDVESSAYLHQFLAFSVLVYMSTFYVQFRSFNNVQYCRFRQTSFVPPYGPSIDMSPWISARRFVSSRVGDRWSRKRFLRQRDDRRFVQKTRSPRVSR